MNITTKIIITDTNIITDLNTAKILEEFANMDNVYVSDLLKYDEINECTGDMNIAKKLKVINASTQELEEINSIILEKPKLSIYDALNFIIARNNNGILATGDNDLKTYSENHGIEVIRTLKIIELMFENQIISQNQAIKAFKLLKSSPTTRIPKDAIDDFINKLEKNSVTVWIFL